MAFVVKVTTTDSYTPEWGGNREQAEPFVVEHLEPTYALYNSLVPKPSIQMKFDKNMESLGGETEAVIDNSRIVRKMVTKIKGLAYQKDNGKEIPVVTGDDLFGPGIPSAFSGLIDELGGYLQKILTNREVDVKN